MPWAVYIPIACQRCDRAWLSTLGARGNGRCRACGQRAAPIAGESYQDSDVELFERVEAVVYERQLSELNSRQLWATLSNVCERARRPERLLLPAVEAIPALAFLLVPDTAQLARSVGMLLVAITAHLRALEYRSTASTCSTRLA